MRVVVIYKEFSDYVREVTEWIEEAERRSGIKIERIDPESVEGETFCQARDIVQYPTIAVVDSDGKTYEQFSGTPLPQIDSVLAYMVS